MYCVFHNETLTAFPLCHWVERPPKFRPENFVCLTEQKCGNTANLSRPPPEHWKTVFCFIFGEHRPCYRVPLMSQRALRRFPFLSVESCKRKWIFQLPFHRTPTSALCCFFQDAFLLPIFAAEMLKRIRFADCSLKHRPIVPAVPPARCRPDLAPEPPPHRCHACNKAAI